ncbi:MAG TPA: hypothetical protein VF644_10375 [Pyrinomonadaceae bacterium]|jgi:hypothetical protein
MPDLKEIIKRINGASLIPPVMQKQPIIGSDLPPEFGGTGFAGNLPVATQAPRAHSMRQFDLPVPDMRKRPAINNGMQYESDLPVITQAPAQQQPIISSDDVPFRMPSIIPVTPNEKEIARALPEIGGRPGASPLDNLPVITSAIKTPSSDLGEPPLVGMSRQQQTRPRPAPDLPVVEQPINPSDSRAVIPTIQNASTAPAQQTPEQQRRQRVVPGAESANANLPAEQQQAEANPREATIGDFFGNVEQLIRERDEYRELKGKDLDTNHDSKMTNFLKGLLNGVRLWNEGGQKGGLAGLLGAIGAGGVTNLASPHMDERIELKDKIGDYDRQIESGFNNLDKLTQLDARRTATDYTRQRPIIETKKEEGRNTRAETVSNDKALSRQQRQTEFESRLNAKLERERKTDSQVRYLESADGRGFLIDKYGKRTPAIDDATGKQFVNPYKQPFELDFGDGEKLTVPQSQAATIKGSIQAKRYEADYRNAMEEYETKESNEALSAAIEAKKGEVKSYEGMLESLRFVNSKLYDDFNDSKQRLESLKDRPDDDPDKAQALQDFRRANNAIKQNERDITEFEEKAVAGNRDLTELNGKFKSAPPKKQAPATKVYPRKMSNNGKYTSTDIQRIIRQ